MDNDHEDSEECYHPHFEAAFKIFIFQDNQWAKDFFTWFKADFIPTYPDLANGFEFTVNEAENALEVVEYNELFSVTALVEIFISKHQPQQPTTPASKRRKLSLM